MRWMAVACLVVLGACGDQTPCGVDDEGTAYPVCTVELVKGASIDYCPGDQWGSPDMCNSCGCDADGEVLCTTITCPGGATE